MTAAPTEAVPGQTEPLGDDGRIRLLGCGRCDGLLGYHMEGPLVLGSLKGFLYLTTVLEEHLVEEKQRRDGLRVFGLPTDLRRSSSPGWTEHRRPRSVCFDRRILRQWPAARTFPGTMARAPFLVHCPARASRGQCGALNLVKGWDTSWSGFHGLPANLTVIDGDPVVE